MKNYVTKICFIAVVIFVAAIFLRSQSKKLPIENMSTPFVGETAMYELYDLELAMDLTQKQYGEIKEDLSLKVDIPINELTDKYDYIKEDALVGQTELDDLNYQIYKLNAAIYARIDEVLSKKQRKKLAEMKKHGFMNAEASLGGRLKGYVKDLKTEEEIPMGIFP